MILLNAAPAQSARQAISQKLPTRFVSGYSHHKQEIVMHTQKTGLDLRLIANHPFFQFEA
ncbi:hypothetical protein HMPREF0542_10214 [Ligilactobacillus ruminis ATCC 25644]|uniref:Uncharacterized protein n=1 Tax=Ligilactobacillus ruminis ATCC 25644 TaxID=525362 RepID=E7FMT7_9LACO|nr:hypothetical protein HMPREF0542_10214 [Ligilactobacillus ruminis ATCC 25644]